MKIIKNAEVLRSNYIPEKLLFREDLVENIRLKVSLGTGNLLLHGDTGTGKTATVVNSMKDLENIILIFITCVQYNTFASITKKIIEEIRPYHVFNERGKSTASLSEELIKVLKTKRTKRFVFVFDEVDKLINKERDHQQILGVISEATSSNIILISNDTNALKNLDARIESRLSPEKRPIERYYANEIIEILKERAILGLEEGSYDLEVIARIGRWIYQTSGDIREALNLFYETACLAEKKGCRITLDLFEEAKNNVGEIEFDKIFADLPEHQRLIIAGVVKLSLEEPEGYAEHKRLYNFYENEAKNNNWEPVQIRQFERFLKKIELAKLIQITTRTPKNRRGKLVVSFPKFDVNRFIKQYF
ncbi:MAG: AAA family ATPase [Nanoarchaeota archaeon]